MHCLKNERLKSVILREALPMHLPAMFLIVAKRHGVQAWDAFLDKFGIPAAFFETPPGATEEEAMEFDATVQKLIGEGSGTIPSGAKLHTFETARDNTQTFEARARWCDDALLQLILGGKLTMTTEAGSGTLAGNAHQESFERLCAATARSISECINRQFCRRILREAFPDQPQLALFDLSAQKQEDLTEQAQLIATLSSAGFRPSPETVSEMMGFEVEAVEPTPATPSPFTPGIQPITNRETDSTTPDASAPLTEQELSALQSLSKGFAADQLEADADTIYNALAEAIAPEDTAIENEEGLIHPNGKKCEAVKKPCPIANKPASFPKDWKPIKITDRMTKKEAEKALKNGITATDPLGNNLILDESILQHWGDAEKEDSDIEHRLSFLPVIVESIKNPMEIWEHEDGTRVYMSAYQSPGEGRIYPISFTVNNDSGKIRTFYPNEHSIDKKRKGKLLYQQAQPRKKEG